MKYLSAFILVSLFLLWSDSCFCQDVINDFSKHFDINRFSKTVLVLTKDDQNQVHDTTLIESYNSKKSVWLKINSILGKCDYIALRDTPNASSFLIYSDKAYRKFWINYNGDNKISIVKIIKPKLLLHLIPPPCGY